MSRDVFGTANTTSLELFVAVINEFAKSGHLIQIRGSGKKLQTRGNVSVNPVAATVPVNPIMLSIVDAVVKLNVVVVCVIVNLFEFCPKVILNVDGNNVLNVVINDCVV